MQTNYHIKTTKINYQGIMLLPILIVVMITGKFSSVNALEAGSDYSILYQNICMIDGTVQITSQETEALKSAIAAAGPYIDFRGAECFAVIDQRDEGKWALFTLVGVVGVKPGSDWTVSSNGVWSDLALLHSSDLSLKAAVAGTTNFTKLLALVPDTIFSPEAKAALDPLVPNTSHAEIGPYVFPFTSGTFVKFFRFHWDTSQNYTYWTGTDSKAVDIGSDGNTGANHAPNSLIAAASGWVRQRCSQEGAYTSTYIAVENDDGAKIIYAHLNKSDAPASGTRITQNQPIGSLKSNTFSDGVCGSASQGSTSFHVHFEVPNTTSLTLSDWTLNTSTGTWTRGSETWSAGEWKQVGGGSSGTCYSLTRIHYGSGSDPTASPSNSSGCSSGQYKAGESINLTAYPSGGWHVASWGGTDNSSSSHLTMPSYNHTVTVNYEQDAPSSNWNATFYDGEQHWWDPNYTGYQMCTQSFSGSYLDQNYGTGTPCGGWDGDSWVGDYSGTINFPSGNYVFRTEHDDGAKLILNGSNIGEYGNSGSDWACPARPLSGDNTLRVILKEDGGDARIKVSWTTETLMCNPPATPSNLTATAVSSSQINLTWNDNSSDETTFRVERSPDGSTNWVEIASLSANSSSYSNSGLSPNTKYYYRVRAHRTSYDRYSEYSNVASATTNQSGSPIDILYNGGFEISYNNNLQGWYEDAWTLDYSTFTWDTAAKHSGSRSVKISNNSANDARWIQTVSVQPNSDYRLSGWIKTNNVAHTLESVDAGANLSIMGGFERTNGVFGSAEWTFVSLEFNTGSRSQVDVAARVGMYSGTTTGTAWFDNVKLELLSSPICHTVTTLSQPVQGGNIAKDPPPNCNNGTQYVHGTPVKFTAIPAPGHIFYAWDEFGFWTLPTYYSSITDDNIATAYFKTLRKSIFYSLGNYDGYILESNENSNMGGFPNVAATTFILGDDAINRQYRSILLFNTASLDDQAIITKVTLKIKKSGQVGTNPFSILGGLRVDVRKPFFGTSPGLMASDFQAAASLSNVSTFQVTPINNWYIAVIGRAGHPYINPTGTTQFRLRFVTDDNNDYGADYLSFLSGNYLSTSVRPTLVIEYYLPIIE